MPTRSFSARRCLLTLLVLACGACGPRGGTSGTTPISNTDPHTATSQPSPIAVALVYSGWEIWIGNDDVVPASDPTRFFGALKAIKAGLDKVDLARKAPPGSLGTTIVYDDKPKIFVPMGPIANLTSEALGTQKDYYGGKGAELVRGIELAIAELGKVSVGKKILVILSDGNDIDNAKAGAQLAAIKQRLGTLGIRTIAIVYRSQLSGDDNVILNLAGQKDITVVTVKSADALTNALADALTASFEAAGK